MSASKRPMDTWMIYALLSMFFAGATSIFAKYGLEKIHPDLGILIRTAVILALVAIAGFFSHTYSGISTLTGREIWLLTASGATAFLSWFFYFRAVQGGPVTYVAAIDKGSILVTILLAFILLKEPLKPQLLIGAGLVLAGLLVLAWK